MKDNSRRNIGISFFVNMIFLVLIIVFGDMKYEVSDDYIMDAILSGAFGMGYDPYLLFSNPILGYGLKILYQLTSGVSWYFVMHIFICFCSLWAITYIILERNQRILGVVLSILFVSFFSDDLYLLVQFTKTAAVACCSGGALFLHGYWNKKKRWIACGLGIVLALLGSMVRYSCIHMTLPFLFLIFVGEVIYHWKEKSIKKMVLGLVCCLGMLFVARLGLETGYFLKEQNEEYVQYAEYNVSRAKITDVNGVPYEQVAPQFEEQGYTLADYFMIESWNFIDEDVYTEEVKAEIAAIKKDVNNTVNHSVKGLLKQFWNRKYYCYTVFWGVLILGILSFLLNKKRIFSIVLMYGLTGFLFFYLIWNGRIVYRAEYGVFYCCGVSLVLGIRETVLSSVQKRCLLMLGMISCLAKIPLYIPDKSYEHMNDEEYAVYVYEQLYESWNFKLSKYRCSVSERQPQYNLLQQIERDQDHYYLVDFSTGIQLLYFNYKPWQRIPENLFMQYSYLGGVTMGHPGNYYVWEQNGIDAHNPYRSITNDNIIVIDNYHVDAKLWYIQQEYHPQATKEWLGNVDGFALWKFRRGEP